MYTEISARIGLVVKKALLKSALKLFLCDQEFEEKLFDRKSENRVKLISERK